MLARLPIVALSASLAACHALPTAPTTGPPPGVPDTTVDVLDYVIGEAALWPRTGDQRQHQIVQPARRRVCWVKYADSAMFECWRWDDDWLYHDIDHALDGETGESYRFTDGRWLPRRLPRVGVWTLDEPANRVRWFTPSCREVRGPQGMTIDTGPNVFPIRQRAWLEPARDLGGSLGVRDVLVLAYTPYAPGGHAGSTERFYFARGAGWYRWESARGTRSFTQVGGPAIVPTGHCATAR